MSAYFTNPTRPVLAPPTVAALRAEPSALLSAGMMAIFSGAGAGGLYQKPFFYDAISTVADDGGVSSIKPNDKGVSDPGRWVPWSGGGAASPDFADPVLHVNWGTGASDPVPSVLCGLSVDRGAVTGTERDRAGLFWVEADALWAVGYDTAGDDETLSAHAPIRTSGFYSSGAILSTVGFVRLRQEEAITANVDGTEYNLAVATSGGVAAFGDEGLNAATLDASGDVTITSRLGDVYVRGGHFFVTDASGLNLLVEGDVGGATFDVNGRLRAYDPSGPTLVFDVDVGSGIADVRGAVRVFDPTGAVQYFQADATEVVSLKPNVLTGSTVGFALRNTTPATAIATVQRSPTFAIEAHAWVSAADATFLVRTQLIPTTSNTYKYQWERSKDGGATWTTPLTFTDSTPSQFVSAVTSSSAFAVYSNGGFFFDSDNSGLFRGGSGDLQVIARLSSLPMLLRSPTTTSGQAAFRFYASGGTRGRTETLVEFGDVAAGFTLRSEVWGDGTYAVGGVSAHDWNVRAVETGDSPVAAAVGDRINVDVSGGSVVINLPSVPATPSVRLVDVRVKHIVGSLGASNSITIAAAGGQLVEGAASVVYDSSTDDGICIDLVHDGDGTNWRLC